MGAMTTPGASGSEVMRDRSRGVVPYEEQAEALDQLMREGKIRHWGLSNENTEGVLAFRKAARQLDVPAPAVVQNAYSLLQRQDEYGLIPNAMEASSETGGRSEISYLAYSPLSAGVLSGKYALAEAATKVAGKTKKRRCECVRAVRTQARHYTRTARHRPLQLSRLCHFYHCGCHVNDTAC